MKKTHIIKLLFFTAIIGVFFNVAWVKYQANNRSEETVAYLIDTMDKVLENVDNQLNSLSNIYLPCSEESRDKLEEMVFNSSVLQEITYIENGNILCGDRNIDTQQLLTPLKINHITNNNQQVIYRSFSQRRHIDGVFFILPVNAGWYKVLFDIKYMRFWLKQLTEKRFLYSCMLDNLTETSYHCEQNLSSPILYSISANSKKYPYSVVTGYTNDMFVGVYLSQLPYAILVIISLSVIITLLSYAYFNWRYSLRSDIQGAINRKEFFAFYQPIVNAHTGEWQGAELLVRWLHPNGIVTSPAEFIPAAEQSGQIQQITLQLLEKAAYEKKIISEISPTFYLAINVTASMIANKQYVDSLIAMIKQYPSLQHDITLEFTERETFANVDIGALLAGMENLRNVGVRWALDDFGTGYAGLSTLQMLSFDTLKIDRTFVASSVTDAVTHSILGNIVEMGHKLQCYLVAEGVETAEQATHVAQLGIEFCQGYYFDRPMPFEDFIAKLELSGYNGASINTRDLCSSWKLQT
ncbi:diguanylate phosphodiesterase [Photobacterium proteolyticum]|uniref:cyclic-guanylate-specific phosphodiesterase n=1 Tax=Photobacterium proteolyticum TaxID=1903952 RepID=A0A1Q9G820_9GAMM|nr:EAL domain-containing protein [Photobacterium proteolyticum]OLQ70473.1 diguanylate phosphodiesterase [Photobacterium proteolyticum]